jgi:uncharacterized protein (DUF302 family)
MSAELPPPDGLTTVKSLHGPAETLTRLENSIAAHGLTVFASIDHAAGAKDVGLDLPPTGVVIFGSPKSGTPLMQMSDTIGLQLPLKILVRQQANGETFLAYDDPSWIARRYGLAEAAAPVVAKMQAAMATIAREAAGGSP